MRPPLKQNVFLVSIHDAAPRHSAEICQIIQRIRPLIADCFSVAVIPCPDGQTWAEEDQKFAEYLKSSAGELILHGCTHHNENRISPFSWMVNRANEFSGMRKQGALQQILRGKKEFERLFGAPPMGFTPPAWMNGAVSLSVLEEAGLAYRLGLTRIQLNALGTAPNGSTEKLATYSWDYGRIPLLGWLGEALGKLSEILCSPVPSIVLHPADVRRGFTSRAFSKIDGLISKGASPILPSTLVGVKAQQ